MNPDTIGCVWTGEFDLNTLRVDGEIFESGKKKLRIQKFPNTRGRRLKRNRSRRKSFAVQKNKNLYLMTNFSFFFPSKFPCYFERKDIRVIDISASEKQNCLSHLLSLEFRVLLVPPKAATDRAP